MPEILDRCVQQVRGRGVSESSAFAICMSSLQRAGRIPYARHVSEYEAEFTGFARQTAMPDVLHPAMKAVYPEMSSPDQALVRRLHRIELTDREGVLGLARLHSRVIAINYDGLKRLGNKPVWNGAVLLHEAVHANLGFGEHEATHIEQRFSGKLFGEGLIEIDRQKMYDTLNIAALAQGQREIDVRRNHRQGDYTFLVDVGFTPKLARRILRAGKMIGQRLKENPVTNRAAKSFAKQYLTEIPKDASDFIDKALDEEINKVFMANLGDEDVLKSEHGADYVRTGCDLDGSLEAAGVFEHFVKQSVALEFGQEFRGITGIVPKLRRADYDVAQLSAEDRAGRDAALRELILDAVRSGLVDSSGQPTKTHVMMLMHGFSPVLDRLIQKGVDNDGSSGSAGKSPQGQEAID